MSVSSKFTSVLFASTLGAFVLIISVALHTNAQTPTPQTQEETSPPPSESSPQAAPTPQEEAKSDAASPVAANEEPELPTEVERRASSERIARELSNRNPQLRQQAAEQLARLAAAEQLRLVQGYRLQERDPRVRLALDWALYRLGKNENLFTIANALASARREQAIGYLQRVDDPTALDIFLHSPKRTIRTGILEVLGGIGNERTLAKIEPLVASPDLDVASAAHLAVTQIENRLQKPKPAPTQTRPRQTKQPG